MRFGAFPHLNLCLYLAVDVRFMREVQRSSVSFFIAPYIFYKFGVIAGFPSLKAASDDTSKSAVLSEGCKQN